MLLARVHAADLHDQLGAEVLLDRATGSDVPQLELVWGAGARAGAFARCSGPSAAGGSRCPATPAGTSGATASRRSRAGSGSCRAAGVIERTFAWLARSRRLARDSERLAETGEAMIHAAMTRIMLRRLAKSAA